VRAARIRLHDEAVLSIPLVAVIKGPDNPFVATMRDGLVAAARAITYR
jgi:ABC-type sugar transport system substrate-binding protein